MDNSRTGEFYTNFSVTTPESTLSIPFLLLVWAIGVVYCTKGRRANA